MKLKMVCLLGIQQQKSKQQFHWLKFSKLKPKNTIQIKYYSGIYSS